MKPSQKDIKAIAKIQKLPVNISIDGLTAFMLIAQLQLALRHPSNTGKPADKVREILVNFFLSVSSRPQDWGDPRWHYEFIKFEWKSNDTIYLQNAHIWTTTKLTPPEILGKLGQAIGMILQPGREKELCGRTHLDEDDFWCEEWGELPPVFYSNEYEFMDFD